MHYILTEEEANRLYTVRGQLRMMGNLLCTVRPVHQDIPISPADMGEFMDAQSDVLSDVVASFEARHKAQNDAAADAMRPSDWLHLIRIASGEEHKVHPGSVDIINRKLKAAVQLDDAMAPVLAAWLDALVLSGERTRQANASTSTHLAGWPGVESGPAPLHRALAAYRDRAPLSAANVLEIGRELKAVKAACEHGEFLRRLDQLSIEESAAHRFMQCAARFVADAHEQILHAAGGQSRLFELLSLADAQIDELEKTGATGSLTLADIETMTVKQLREAIRKERNAVEPSLSLKPRRKRESLASVPA